MDIDGRGGVQRSRVSSALHRIGTCLLCALAGCQLSAANFSAAGPDSSRRSCRALLARQLVFDSTQQFVRHPLRTGSEFLYEAGDDLASLAHGAIGKRLLCLRRGPPDLLCHRGLWSDGKNGDRTLCVILGVLSPFFPRSVSATACQGIEPANLSLQLDGTEALAAVHEVIDRATQRIDILMFLWEDDAVGRQVAGWLAAKASPHLRVRVLVDGGGNLIFGRPAGGSAQEVNDTVTALGRQPYVEVVRIRNPLARFDHRKLVVADGHVAWMGGRNFTHRAFFEQHDVSFTMTGPLVEQLAVNFDSFWREQGGQPFSQQPWRVDKPSADTRDAESLSSANAWLRPIETAPRKHQLEQALYSKVDQATDRIYMENVYFSDSRLIYKLAKARRRGVDVRVVLTLDDPTPIVNRANRVIANRLLQAGVRVYLYPGMLHAKAAVVDGCWAYLGSGNFDALSFRHNRELGFALEGGSVIPELEQKLFLADFCPEHELKEPLPVRFRDFLSEIVSALCL